MSSQGARAGQKKPAHGKQKPTSNGPTQANGSDKSKSPFDVVGVLTGKLFRADLDNRTWGQCVQEDVEMVIAQKKNEPNLTFLIKVFAKSKEVLKQQLNLSLRVRLKDDLVQWQLKKNAESDPVTFGLRCSGQEDAVRLENLLKDIRYNLEVDQRTLVVKKKAEEIFLKANLPDNQSTKVAVTPGMTVNSLFVLIVARRRLDPTKHEIRINQGKYLAAVKPTLAVHSLGVTEVFIVQVHSPANRTQGASRIITIRLPDKKDTYIQVKDQRKVRDLYAYICEKKDLTPSLYRLKYNCKVEGESDMEKTIGQLDLWSVELESAPKMRTPVKQAAKPTASGLGVEETDSGPPVLPQSQRKPRRAAPGPPQPKRVAPPPPPGKKKDTPVSPPHTPAPEPTPREPPKGIPLVGIAGKKLRPPETPPIQRPEQSTHPSSYSTEDDDDDDDDDDDSSFVVVPPFSTSTPKPQPQPAVRSTRPAGSDLPDSSLPHRGTVENGEAGKGAALVKSQSSSPVATPGQSQPKRRAPLPPGVAKKSQSVAQESSSRSTIASSQSEDTISRSSSRTTGTPEPLPRRMNRASGELGSVESLDCSSLPKSNASSPEVHRKMSGGQLLGPQTEFRQSPLATRRELSSERFVEPKMADELAEKKQNAFDSEFDDINSFFNDIIADADTHLGDTAAGGDSPVQQPRSTSVLPPVAKPRSSPPTPSRSSENLRKDSPLTTPGRTPPSASPVLSREREGFSSNESSDGSSPRLRRQSGLVKDSTGKQMLVVYPSPTSGGKTKTGALAFQIPPPPRPETGPNQNGVREEENADELNTTASGDENDESFQRDKEGSDYLDSESDQEAHYILGLTPSASFDVAGTEHDGIESIRHKMADITKSDIVTTSFSEETGHLEANGSDKDMSSDAEVVETEQIDGGRVDDTLSADQPATSQSIPPPLPTPKVSTADGMGFFLPPPDEFEAPKPPLPACSPPESSDDDYSPYSQVAKEPAPVPRLQPPPPTKSSSTSKPVKMRSKTGHDMHPSNRPISVHGNLINVISNLQGLLSEEDSDGDDGRQSAGESSSNSDSKITDFSKPLVAASQGESSDDDDITFTNISPSQEKLKAESSFPVPPPPPPTLPAVRQASSKAPSNPPAPSSAVATPTRKAAPPVMKKPLKSPSQGEVDQELKAKLKRRQDRIRDEDITENKTAPPSSSLPFTNQHNSTFQGVQPNFASPSPSPSLPTQAPTPQAQQNLVPSMQNPMMMMPMDPQQMVLQQQMLHQQVMQLQQQLQMLQTIQGSGGGGGGGGGLNATGPVQGMSMMNSLQMQQQMLMMMSQGTPQATQNNISMMPQGTPQGIQNNIAMMSQGNSVMANSTSSPNLSDLSSNPGMIPGVPGAYTTQSVPSTPRKGLKSTRGSVSALSDVTSIRSGRMGDLEGEFDKVMEEVRDTNPMTILRKVNAPNSQASSSASRKSSQMEDAIMTAMKDRRSQLNVSRHSQHEDDFDSSW